MPQPLVGRAAELDRLVALLAAPEARFAIVDGEPGIGKSRLTGEFARIAAARGRVVLTGRATEFERTVPYGIVLDATAAVPDDRGDLRPLFTVLTEADGDSDGIGRHQRHRRLRALLTGLARPAGAVLVLDDVHWADDASADLLGYLLRHPPGGPVTVVLACRTGQCPPRLAEALAHHLPSPMRLTLGPITAADVDSWLPAEPPARRRLLHQLSAGNPLCLELLAGASAQHLGALRRGENPDEPIGSALRSTIAAEVGGLTGAERLTLHAAAVIGANLGPGAVSATAALDPARTAEALDALVARDLLRQAGGTLDFRHPLVRAVAYWTSGPAWRLDAHHRAASHLRATGAPLPVRAQHIAKGIQPGDEESAGVLADAARATMDVAPATSVAWLRAALTALPAPAPRRDELRLLLAKALGVTGRFDEARAMLRELIAAPGAYRSAGVEHLASLERLGGRHDLASKLLTAELRNSGAAGAAEAMLRLELAANKMMAGRWNAAARDAGRAIERARGGGHHGIAAAAHTVLAGCEMATAPPIAARARIGAAGLSIDALDDDEVRDELGAVALQAWMEVSVDRLADGLAHADRGIEIGRRFGRVHVLPQLYSVRAFILGTIGRVADALRDAEEAEEIARWQRNAESIVLASAVRLRPLLWVSGPDAVHAALERMHGAAPVRSRHYQAIVAMHLAQAYLAVDDHAACQRLLTDPEVFRCLGPAESTPLTLRAISVGTHGWVHPAGDGGPAAAEVHGWLARATAVADELPARLGMVGIAGAVLALARSHPAEAAGLATPAVTRLTRAGLPVHEGEARMLLAEAQFATGDAPGAREQLGRAKRLFTAAGALWLTAQADRAQRSFAARAPRRRTDEPGLLSAREREVAELVAQGLTNLQIAAALVLSPRTVESHVTRIIGKLGVPSRAAVARQLETS